MTKIENGRSERSCAVDGIGAIVKAAKGAVEPASVMADYFDYVRQYQVASAALGEDGAIFWPRLQIRGLLVELALKTFLCAAGTIEERHDLEKLATSAQILGLELSDGDWAERISNVNKIYFRFVDWNAKYLARYPAPDRGLGVWVTPTHASLNEMIGRIVDQAHKKWGEEGTRQMKAKP